ncbi:MAG: hypothetical protein IPM69_08940 [Ignavibacteria bacterium]|nr:hypothetical protein [Ignavibacteria bacterium]
MKTLIFILLVGLCTLKAFSQVNDGLYKGLERMCWKNEKGNVECYDAPRKWYHENTVLIEKDSIFIYKVPLHVIGKKKYYSASDGAFFYYLGVIHHTDRGDTVRLTMNNCDYCYQSIQIDTITGFMYPISTVKNYKLSIIPKGIKIGDVSYRKLSSDEIFPPKKMFYFDSNSIYRYDPKGQYTLISTAINNFLQNFDSNRRYRCSTEGVYYLFPRANNNNFLQDNELILKNDSLRISLDRICKTMDRMNDSTIEMLDSEKLKINTSGIVLIYTTKKELEALAITSNQPIRYIEVGEIIDRWKSARISLKYTSFFSKNTGVFSEYEFSNLLEFKKDRGEYVINNKECSMTLIEQK